MKRVTSILIMVITFHSSVICGDFSHRFSNIPGKADCCASRASQIVFNSICFLTYASLVSLAVYVPVAGWGEYIQNGLCDFHFDSAPSMCFASRMGLSAGTGVVGVWHAFKSMRDMYRVCCADGLDDVRPDSDESGLSRSSGERSDRLQGVQRLSPNDPSFYNQENGEDSFLSGGDTSPRSDLMSPGFCSGYYRINDDGNEDILDSEAANQGVLHSIRSILKAPQKT